MVKESYIFVVGASRGVGKEIIKNLLKQNQKVKALLRSHYAKSQLEEMGIKVAIGDALQLAEVENALLGEETIAAVISTIGGKNKDGVRADYLGNKNLIDAAIASFSQEIYPHLFYR